MTLSKLIFLLMLYSFTGMTFNDEPQDTNTASQLLTVCEALEQRDKWNDKIVAIVAVLGPTPEGNWLSDDGCTQKVVTDGFGWPNLISLEYNPTAAPDPSGLARIEDTDIGRKLELVKKRNRLRGDPTANGLNYSDRWVVVYGRFQSRTDLKPAKIEGGVRTDWGNGYGHLNGSPARLVIKQGSIRFF